MNFWFYLHDIGSAWVAGATGAYLILTGLRLRRHEAVVELIHGLMESPAQSYTLGTLRFFMGAGITIPHAFALADGPPSIALAALVVLGGWWALEGAVLLTLPGRSTFNLDHLSKQMRRSQYLAIAFGAYLLVMWFFNMTVDHHVW